MTPHAAPGRTPWLPTVRMIGLRRSWRGEDTARALEEAGVPVHRVDGVDASDPATLFDGRPLRDWVDETGCRLVFRRPLTTGEIGCALAHLATQRAMVAAGEEWSVVLEDDATSPRPEDLVAVLDWCRTQLITEPTVVLLHSLGAIVSSPPLARVGSAAIWSTVLPPDLALGYVLNRAAAELLTAATLPLIGPADWPPRVAGRMRFLVVDPPVVDHREVRSTIGDRPGDSWPRWSRPLRRILLVTGLLWPWYRRYLPGPAYRCLEWRRFYLRRRLGRRWSATSTRVTHAPSPWGRRRARINVR